MPRDDSLIHLGPWPAGIDNLNPETALARNDNGNIVALREAVNVDIPRTGWPRRRRGFTRIATGANVHSLWGDGEFPLALFMAGGTQYAFAEGGVPFIVRTGLSDRPVSYARPADAVYCSNGVDSWKVSPAGDSSGWAVESPIGQPTLAPVTGGSSGLDAGTYQVAVTYIDMLGAESGTGQAGTVTLPAGGIIAASAIPQPQSGSVVKVRIYATEANGTVLHARLDLSVGVTATTISRVAPGRPLATQFLEPMPAGAIVRALAGRLWVATRGGALVWSEALRYGLTDRAHASRYVGDDVRMVEPVGNGGDGSGLFVADAHKVYWFGGSDPDSQTRRIVSHSSVVRGSSLTVPGDVFGLETTQPVAYWLGSDGVACLGLPGGSIVALQDKQAVAPRAGGGASVFVETNGVRKVVTTLRDTGGAQSLAVGDSASAKVWRNGVEV